VRWLVNRNRAEQRLDDELQTFIEFSAAEKIRAGLAPAEARRLAVPHQVPGASAYARKTTPPVNHIEVIEQ
jgi:hypothetical protein